MWGGKNVYSSLYHSFVASFIKYSMNILFQGINPTASLQEKRYHVAGRDIIYVLYYW